MSQTNRVRLALARASKLDLLRLMCRGRCRLAAMAHDERDRRRGHPSTYRSPEVAR